MRAELYLLAGIILVGAMATAAQAAPSSRVSPRPEGEVELSGTWNVTFKPLWSDCDSKSNTNVYQWLLANDGSNVSVTVLGETGFPKLSGRFDKSTGEMNLSGGAKEAKWRFGRRQIFAHSVFRLVVQGRKLEGTRFYLGLMDKGWEKRACMTAFSVVGTKQ